MLQIHHSSQPTEEFFQLGKKFSPPPFETEYFVLSDGEKTIARAAAIINPQLDFNGENCGQIGLYECINDDAAAKKIISAVEEFFREKNFSFFIGPMNGSTWHSYRFAELGGETFFFDTANQKYYAEQFRKNNFSEIAKYYSTKKKSEKNSSDRVEKFLRMFAQKGIKIREFQKENFESELRKIYEISIDSFRKNFLYTDIGFAEFAVLYEPVRELINPRYVLIAEDDNSPLAFIFCTPDILNQNKSLIIKTVATRPLPQARGLGTLLVEMMHRRAADDDFENIIHALMHEENSSMNIMADGHEVIRRYTLFGKKL